MTATVTKLEIPESTPKSRQAVFGAEPDILTEIYQDENNIAIWRRGIQQDLVNAANRILVSKPTLQLSAAVSNENAYEIVNGMLGNESDALILAADVAELVDMFCCLFELKGVGLRLTSLGHAMCPRFHVDKVPCRLVTTYNGTATEWLPHDYIDRAKLGPGSRGLPDDQSGLYPSDATIQKLEIGDVALLKGESWIGNENAGLVHRSPQLPENSKRLLLTLDFANS